jgi:imidazolonepropionase-like amidohydrolase
MMTKPNGYGQLYINSSDEAKRKTNGLIDAGVDAIKVSLEDGYAGQRNLPKLTEEELKTIIEEAHRRGIPVSAHITQARYQAIMVKLGVDDVAHLAVDYASDELIASMVKKHIFWIPTFTVFRNFGASLDDVLSNLKVFVKAGGQVALGNDFGGGPGKFELGIPMYEVTMMRMAGMTPMQIILACTRNAAQVCHREKQLGTLETGKIADILVIEGNPLKDLKALAKTKFVFKDGVPIVTAH